MRMADPSISALLDWEALLLDERRFDEWLELLTDDAWYWVPLDPRQRRPLDGPSHIYETRDALLARVYRLKDPQNLTQQPPSRCSRVMGRPYHVAGDGEGTETVVRASFHLAESRPHQDADESFRHFAGTITYGLVGDDGASRIRWRRVDLINSEKGLHGVSILI
ncbi:MAG: hypothetical protein KIT16_02555 [Rhodospirillaceae bacterium]|nr:hypothetical protein [Rhodospirillaceae bacterium]